MTQGMPPYSWVPPAYSLVEQVSEMGDAVAQAHRQREEIARQIGQSAVQATTLIVPPQ